MAQVQVYSQEGRKTSKMELADSVFGIEPNADAMHLAVVGYQEARSGHTAVLLLVLSQENIK